MAEKAKAKAKKYGKKASKVGDLVADFANLDILDSPQIFSSKAPPSSPQRLPLRTRSGNRSPRGRKAPRPRTAAEINAIPNPASAYYQRLLEVTKTSEIEHFNHWADTTRPYFRVSKIGDGSYADVYKLAAHNNPLTDYVIAKLIPIRPERKDLIWEDMTSIEDAVTEICLLDSVTEIPGFVEYRGARVLYGPLPILIQIPTDTFNDIRKQGDVRTENRKGRMTYPDNQVWLLVEMSDAGQDLDNLLQEGHPDGPLPLTIDPDSEEMRLDIRQTRDVFWATANTLAYGEGEVQFEHRDLHLSNICVKRNQEGFADETYAIVPSSSQLEVVLIDYTLSRAEKEGKIIYNPMSDQELFTGTGDLQYETYRHMRTAVTVKKTPRWEDFVPMTNVLWLHHLLVKLLEKTHGAAEDNLPERELWEYMEGLRDSTSPRNMARGWDYLSAADLIAMGKVGRAAFVSEVLKSSNEEASAEEGAAMQKAKAGRLKRLSRESTTSLEKVPPPRSSSRLLRSQSRSEE